MVIALGPGGGRPSPSKCWGMGGGEMEGLWAARRRGLR